MYIIVLKDRSGRFEWPDRFIYNNFKQIVKGGETRRYFIAVFGPGAKFDALSQFVLKQS